MSKIDNNETKTTSITLYVCLYCYLLTYFGPSFRVYLVQFAGLIFFIRLRNKNLQFDKTAIFI